MVQENDVLDETDFDDAIIEIAGEIEYLKSVQKSEMTHEPQVSLKSDVEVKKAESISHHLFQILKTIQEVQVSSGQRVSPSLEPNPFVTSKYIPLTKGKDHLYQPIIITESPLESLDEETKHPLTLEDLFEDEPPTTISSNVTDLGPTAEISPLSAQLYKPTSQDIPAMNTVIIHAHKHAMVSQKPSPQTPKSIDIPSHINQNIRQQLNRNERDIFKNFMKIQKK